jgi:hypothetical protein
MNKIVIPQGRLADDAALAAKRAELKRKLLEGGKITLKKDGNATGGAGEASTISIPQGKLADDAALAAKRAELKRKLLEGGKITLKKNGNATGGEGEASTISIPQGKLASQWYERDPELLEAEKMAMARAFKGFELGKLDDGRLYWIGTVTPGIYETKFGERRTYNLMAVYQQNHPEQKMGSSVFVYPLLPDAEELMEELYRKKGQYPSHILRDANNQRYLCTAESSNIKVGSTVTTAASVIGWAVKWLMAFELVLTGDLPVEKFNEHHGI